MSMTQQEYEFDEFISQLYEEHKELAINEFKSDKLSGYFSNNHLVIEKPHKLIKQAIELQKEYATASFLFAAIATEVILKQALIKPIVFGLVHHDMFADLISDTISRQNANNNFRKFVFNILNEFGGIDIDRYVRQDAEMSFWDEIEKVRQTRNKVVHFAEQINAEDSQLAIDVAKAMKDIFIEIIDKIGFHIHDEFRICNDWRCKIDPETRKFLSS